MLGEGVKKIIIVFFCLFMVFGCVSEREFIYASVYWDTSIEDLTNQYGEPSLISEANDERVFTYYDFNYDDYSSVASFTFDKDENLILSNLVIEVVDSINPEVLYPMIVEGLEDEYGEADNNTDDGVTNFLMWFRESENIQVLYRLPLSDSENPSIQISYLKID